MPLEYFQSKELNRLHQRLGSWFMQEARDLPWRRTKNPYYIWLSEVILQQTQVVQGLDYYHKFTETYPRVEDLASADEDEVLKLWQGLGYYSRARNLLRSAKMIVEDFGGKIPQELDEIKKLPGVGPYTQAAILSFAYDLPYAAVDGNVYRVLSRLFAIDTPIDKPAGQKLFRDLAQDFINLSNPAQHNQAMIELGALCCTPRTPQCSQCPFDTACLSYAQGTMLQYPQKVGKIKVKERYFSYMLITLHQEDGDYVLIHRRGEGDIWQGLYELPLVETAQEIFIDELLQNERAKELLKSAQNLKIASSSSKLHKHRLTHQLLLAKLFHFELSHLELNNEDYKFIPVEEFSNYAIPVLLSKLLKSYKF